MTKRLDGQLEYDVLAVASDRSLVLARFVGRLSAREAAQLRNVARSVGRSSPLTTVSVMDVAGTPSETGVRSRSVHVLVAPLAAVMAVLMLLMLASSSGSVRVWSEPPPPAPRSQQVEPIVVDDTGGAAEIGEGIAPPRDDSDGWFMRTIALITGLVLLRVAYMVVVGWWAILRSWRFERERSTTSPFDVLPNMAQPPSVSLDENAQMSALRAGEPRNAIVACWMRLEDDVAAAGLPPLASETSAELTARVLEAALADRMAIIDLADRYREARFSDHPIGERERELALDALGRIHASLRLPRPAA